ncbi:MAG: molybdenum cofactor biosynthesis protein B [Spirochaetia bacterium]|nr:MogA/MoaB family molybdenum cofactor biosynthesis protein [Spirochaetia bacterium]
MKVAVITISDRASRGQYADVSGPEIEKAVLLLDAAAEVSRQVVPDEEPEIRKALEAAAGADFILTTGGTGISPRDVTPEVTMRFCDKELPGIAEVLRAQSWLQTPAAVLSRGYAGLHGRSVVVNFPGSVNAVRLCMKVLGPVMEHAVRMLGGEGH